MTLAALWHKLMPPIPWSKTLYGNRVFFNLRDGLYWLRVTTGELEKMEHWSKIISGTYGTVWDVGCNIGVFSLLAASKGMKVIAFDPSIQACRYLARGCLVNKLTVIINNCAFTVSARHYKAILTSNPDNILEDGTERSVTYMDAIIRFGVPSLIKIDIEGGEKEFLMSKEFGQWAVANKVSILLELHGETRHNVWDNASGFVQLNESHILFNPTEMQIKMIDCNLDKRHKYVDYSVPKSEGKYL